MLYMLGMVYVLVMTKMLFQKLSVPNIHNIHIGKIDIFHLQKLWTLIQTVLFPQIESILRLVNSLLFYTELQLQIVLNKTIILMISGLYWYCSTVIPITNKLYLY